jgi:excisionase family DNA binding protein
MVDAPLLLKPREAARLLAISDRTLWGMARSGKIPCVRFGRVLRYDPADLKAWIQGQKSGS